VAVGSWAVRQGCRVDNRFAAAGVPPRMLRAVLAVALFVALGGCTGQEGNGMLEEVPKTVQVTSAFDAHGRVPTRYTCDGEEVSVPLVVSGLPEGTERLAVVFDDPDAPRGTWVHWVFWDLAPSAALGDGADPADHGATVGRNSWGRNDYGGPCPPSGEHRYVLKAYALDAPLGLPAATDADGLRSAMDGRVLAWGELVGTYSR